MKPNDLYKQNNECILMKGKNIYWIYPIVSFLFLLLTSHTTSPLYRYCSGDSSFLVLIGKAITEGKLVYKDIFDHKGPILFFIEAFAQSIIPGKTGVFLYQIFNLSVILVFMHKISLLFIPRDKVWVVIGTCLLFFWGTIGDGNTCEEYNLFLSIIPFYLALKYFRYPTTNHPLKYSFVYGVFFSLIAFLRLNDIVIIGSICLTLIFYLCTLRQWKSLLQNALAFIVGCACVCIPLFWYFYSKDAVSEMLYGTFLFNFKYSVDGSLNVSIGSLLLWLFIDLLISLFLIVNALSFYKENKNKYLLFLILSSCIFSFLSLTLLGFHYPHYYIMALPFICLSVSLWIHNQKKFEGKKKIAFYMAIGIFFSLIVAYSAYRSWKLYCTVTASTPVFNYPDYKIPEEDKDSVIGYMVPSNWYLENDILPCYKYYTLQEWVGRFDPQILLDFNEMMEKNPPKWVLIPREGITNTTMISNLDRFYEQMAESSDREPVKGVWHFDISGYILYKLKIQK